MTLSSNSQLYRSGIVTKAQTTFCMLRDAALGREQRIDYVEKQEAQLQPHHFEGMSLHRSHPLLEQHEYTWARLYVSSQTERAKEIAAEIRSSILSVYDGFRSSIDYCNERAGLENILESGYGLGFRGPHSGLTVVIEVLKRYNLSFSCLEHSEAKHEKYQVLIIGQGYIVARDFVFAEI